MGIVISAVLIGGGFIALIVHNSKGGKKAIVHFKSVSVDAEVPVKRSGSSVGHAPQNGTKVGDTISYKITRGRGKQTETEEGTVTVQAPASKK